MGCLALSLSAIFRLKFHSLNGLPKDLSATVFNRTFIVFNPYPEQNKVIHQFLLALPAIALFATSGLLLGMLEIFTSGFMLSFFAIIIGLNLIGIGEAREVYKNSSTFVKAIQKGTNLATGDLKALQLMKKLTPKLSSYYPGLAVFFITSSITLPYVLTSAPWLFIQSINLMTQFSGFNEIVVLPVTVILFALSLSIVQLLAFKIKNRIFKFETK